MWDQTLRSTGFSGLDIQVQDCEDPAYVMSTMMTTATKPVSPPVELDISIVPLADDIPDVFLDSLKSRLNTQSMQRVTVDGLEHAKAEGKTFIFIDAADSVLARLNGTQFDHLRRLLTTANYTLWVSRGASGPCEEPLAALHIGLLRTLRCENSEVTYVSLDLDPRRRSWTTQCLDTVMKIFTESFATADERYQKDNEFSERDGIIRVSRILESAVGSRAITDDLAIEEELFFQDSRELRLEAQNPGMLDSLVFKDVSGRSEPLPSTFVEIKPMAFGLNFRDVMVAMGQLDVAVMGVECSGIVARVGPGVDNGLQVGDKVCGLLRGHWANRVQVDCKSMIPIPDGLDYATAASIPVVYITAYYSLVELARLQPGETVLIHCGAGGVGQAAIMLAKYLGAEVFATAGSPEKRSFLCKTYDLSPDHISSDRDTSFVAQILGNTNRKGVDVVLNSLHGRLLQETWRCVAPFGRFVEIGKRDLESNHNLEMEPFTRNVSFMSVDMMMVGEQRRDLIATMLRQIMLLFKEGKLSPVSPLTARPLAELQKAFRLLQSGKTLGKVVLCPGKDEMVKVGSGALGYCMRTPWLSLYKVQPQKRVPRLRSWASYVLVGGSGGLGRSIARMLVERGARHLILLSRNAQSYKHLEFYTDLRAAGCEVVARNCNIADKADLARALEECKGMPPVRGIIQGAMVLQVRHPPPQ